jgi:uncharacterized protein YkwD
MSRFFRPLVVALGFGAAFGLGFSLHAQEQDEVSFDLVTYRTALEQLRAGRPQNAQILLENAQRSAPMASENALLLAYLEDSSGQSDAARRTLSGLETPSPLAGAYLRRLGVQVPDSLELKSGASKNPARLAASDARLTKIETFMLGLVNDAREQNGLPRLELDPRLSEVARAHSAEMRDKKYFAHESPTGSLRFPLDRYEIGYGGTPRVIAENIYRIYGHRSFLTQADTRDAHEALMHSPGHRANLLNRDVTRIGIGFSTNSTGDLWITQMFSLRN